MSAPTRLIYTPADFPEEPEPPRRERKTYDPTAPKGPLDCLDLADWADLLEPEGWSYVGEERSTGAELWMRPGGASSKYSLKCWGQVCVCWSENASLPSGKDHPMNKAQLFAHLHHGGDMSEATRDLCAAARGEEEAGPARALPTEVLDAVRALGPTVLERDRAGWEAAGVDLDKAVRFKENNGAPEQTTNGSAPAPRRLVMRKASSFTPRPVKWAWDTRLGMGGGPAFAEGRFPIGSLVIAVGRAGVGKSQFACWFTAMITRGLLPGEFFDKPRSVIYCATEDSWEMTIIPRLIAAGADLDRVYHVAVADDGDEHAKLTLPSDTAALEQEIKDHDVAVIVMDPLLSLIDSTIDDYRGREVRSALEPLIAVADRTRALLLGLAHFNKATGSDPLLLVQGSAAFGQLVRAAVAFIRDEDEEAGPEKFILSTIKNNLGRENLPSLGYVIEPVPIPTEEGDANVSRLTFTGASARSVRDMLNPVMVAGAAKRHAVDSWLEGYLAENGNRVDSKKVLDAATDAGFSPEQTRRAKERLRICSAKSGFTAGWDWVARAYTPPSSPSSAPSRSEGVR